MKNLENIKEFECSLMKHLNDGAIDKISLKTVSAEIVNLKKNGLGIDQVFVKGKIQPDRVLINGTVDPDFFRRLNNLKNIRRLEIFPYGIINPEGFRFKITMRL